MRRNISMLQVRREMERCQSASKRTVLWRSGKLRFNPGGVYFLSCLSLSLSQPTGVVDVVGSFFFLVDPVTRSILVALCCPSILVCVLIMIRFSPTSLHRSSSPILSRYPQSLVPFPLVFHVDHPRASTKNVRQNFVLEGSTLMLSLLSFMFHRHCKQVLFKDIYISDEPYLGLGSSLVLQNNLNMTLLNQRIALGAKGRLLSFGVLSFTFCSFSNCWLLIRYITLTCLLYIQMLFEIQWWLRTISCCRRSLSKRGVRLTCVVVCGTRFCSLM